MPIAVALDLHGYITPKLVSAATIITGYRTTPHKDIRETGERAMTLLDAIIRRGGAAPRAVMTRLPFVTRGNDETSSGPLLEIGKIADQWRARPDLIDLSIFNIHPFLDVPDLGQVVLAYDEGKGSAVQAVNDISQRVWDSREAFSEQLISVEEALRQASHSSKPFALGDQGDRVVGAGPGDLPEIARIALERFPNLRVAVRSTIPRPLWRRSEPARAPTSIFPLVVRSRVRCDRCAGPGALRGWVAPASSMTALIWPASRPISVMRQFWCLAGSASL